MMVDANHGFQVLVIDFPWQTPISLETGDNLHPVVARMFLTVLPKGELPLQTWTQSQVSDK